MRAKSPASLAICLAILLSPVLSARAQGSFRNLGFESATLVPVPGQPAFYYSAQAFPGWTVSIGGSQSDVALYNNVALDSSEITIIDHVWDLRPYPFLSPAGVIDGSFTAVLQAGLTGIGNPTDTTLSQTALVPTTAESLLFKGYLPGNSLSGVLVVTLGGQQLSLTPLASGTNYTLYGADIHALAGQTAELDFTLLTQQPHVGDRYFFLDSIQFSPQVIPEPGIFGLGVLGAMLLGWRARRQGQ
jgi:hypothetical protein